MDAKAAVVHSGQRDILEADIGDGEERADADGDVALLGNAEQRMQTRHVGLQRRHLRPPPLARQIKSPRQGLRLLREDEGHRALQAHHRHLQHSPEGLRSGKERRPSQLSLQGKDAFSVKEIFLT